MRYRPLDSLHVAHGRLHHRTAHWHRCELDTCSVLRQVTDSRSECSVPRDVATCECLAVIVIITCHLRSVTVVTVVHAIPLVFSLDPSLSSLVLLLLQGTRCRGAICALQLKAFQYFSDTSLVCLNCDAVTIPCNDTTVFCCLRFFSFYFPFFCFVGKLVWKSPVLRRSDDGVSFARRLSHRVCAMGG